MIFNTMSFDTGGPGSLRALSICTSQESVWVQTVYGCKKEKRKLRNLQLKVVFNLFTNSSIYSYITAFIHSYCIFP